VTVGKRRRQPSLAQLRAFAAVAEHLHFRDAAAATGVSQPALSGAVSALEETLGVTLLERTTRRVLLSPAGERLAVRAKAVLEEIGALMEEADALRAPFTGRREQHPARRTLQEGDTECLLQRRHGARQGRLAHPGGRASALPGRRRGHRGERPQLRQARLPASLTHGH